MSNETLKIEPGMILVYYPSRKFSPEEEKSTRKAIEQEVRKALGHWAPPKGDLPVGIIIMEGTGDRMEVLPKQDPPVDSFVAPLPPLSGMPTIEQELEAGLDEKQFRNNVNVTYILLPQAKYEKYKEEIRTKAHNCGISDKCLRYWKAPDIWIYSWSGDKTIYGTEAIEPEKHDDSFIPDIPPLPKKDEELMEKLRESAAWIIEVLEKTPGADYTEWGKRWELIDKLRDFAELDKQPTKIPPKGLQPETLNTFIFLANVLLGDIKP